MAHEPIHFRPRHRPQGGRARRAARYLVVTSGGTFARASDQGAAEALRQTAAHLGQDAKVVEAEPGQPHSAALDGAAADRQNRPR
jgi:hypothetical protein